ncbi:MAG TPA: nickel insertion protein, partial [Phytomonospora sp.]
MIGWLDCGAGASGDMFLGALVDAGVPLEILQEAVDALGVERVELHADPVTRHGLAAAHVRVECPPTKVDRRYVAIRDLIQAAPLPQEVRDEAVGAFTRLG